METSWKLRLILLVVVAPLPIVLGASELRAPNGDRSAAALLIFTGVFALAVVAWLLYVGRKQEKDAKGLTPR
jgi:uncharacterized membrane protein